MTTPRVFAAVTKIIAVVLTVAAAAVFTYVYGGSWRFGWWIAGLAFLIPALLVRLVPKIAVFLVLVAAYLTPAIVGLVTGPTHPIVHQLWIVMLLGLVVSSGRITEWHFPVPWKYPLVAWCLVVALSGFVVMAREADFAPWITFYLNLPNTGSGGPPNLVVAWMASSVAGLATGLLWFDWLFQRFVDKSQEQFEREIVVPLVVGIAASSVVAAIQSFIDPMFLNTGFFGYLRRASGAMLDANAYGVLAAIWAVVLFGAAANMHSRSPVRFAAWAIAALAGVGAWMSASRSCLVILVCGVTVAASHAFTRMRNMSPEARRRVAVILTASIVVLGILGAQIKAGPVQRLMESLPDGPGPIVRELWNRGPYGPAAALMIRESPLVGIGVGAFHFLVHDYSMRATYIRPGPDNAQNWYRHQFAELGVLGSVPWIVWLALFGALVVRSRRVALASPLASGLLSALIGFALASLVGVPGQNHAVAITLWVLGFWYVRVAAPNATQMAGRAASIDARWPWAVVAVVVLLHGAATLRAAEGDLRVPNRAAVGGWRYSYGFYGPEKDADGREFRWAGKRALVVLDAPTRWMKLTVAAPHLDITRRPADVKVWCDGITIFDTRITDRARLTRYLLIPERKQRVVVELTTSRVSRPRDIGIADDRELGLWVAWEFTSEPPGDPAAAVMQIR